MGENKTDVLPEEEPFCACGRRWSKCDGSRRGCPTWSAATTRAARDRSAEARKALADLVRWTSATVREDLVLQAEQAVRAALDRLDTAEYRIRALAQPKERPSAAVKQQQWGLVADAIRHAARAAYDRAIEVCEAYARDNREAFLEQSLAAESCARQIRALRDGEG